nr:helix-turn-helix domain-containing protein [Fredinandcohnia onubensis]
MRKIYHYVHQNFKEKKFRIKILIFSLMISIIPIIVTSIITFVNANNLFREDAASKNIVLTNQVKRTLEVLIYQVEESGKQLLSNPPFQNFQQFSDGKYFKALSGPLDPEDVYLNYAYIKYKHESIDLINQFRVTNPLIQTVHFYDKDKELILSFQDNQIFKQYDLNTMYQREFYQKISEYRELTYLVQHQDPFNVQKDNRVTSLVIRSNSDNFLVIKLNKQVIQNQIFSKLTDQNNLVVISDDKEIFYQSEKNNVPKTIKETVLSITDEDETAVKDGYLITSNYSPILGMNFVSYESVDNLNQALNSLKKQMILILCTLIVAVFIIVFLYTKRLYLPIAKVVSAIKGYRNANETDTKDEFQFIQNYLQMTKHTKEQLIRELKESLPHYKENFIRSLFKHNQWTLEDIKRKFTYLKIDMNQDPILCFVLSIDYYRRMLIERDTNYVELYRMKIIHYLDNYDYRGRKTLVVKVEDDKIAVVLTLKEMNKEIVMNMFREIVNHLHESTGDCFTVGVSNIHDDFTSLPEAFHEANDALNYRILYGKNKVIQWNKIDVSSEIIKGNLPSIINEFRAKLKLGLAESAYEQLETLIEELKDNPIRSEEIRLFFIRLLEGVQHEVILQGAEMKELIGLDPYYELSNKLYSEEILAMFHTIAKKIAGKEDEIKDSPHIRKIMDIIENDLSQDLSLTAVADQLALNPSYVSRIFKEFVGENYVDFITNRRIEKGKDLLKTTKQTIGEIAKDVGYQNSYYFIKLFKKAEGMTPGQFRKKYT